MKLSEKYLINLVAQIVKEELDPDYEAKRKHFVELVQSNFGPEDFFEALKEVIEENVLSKKEHSFDRLISDVSERITLGTAVQDFIKAHNISEDDADIVYDILDKLIMKFYNTPAGKKEVQDAFSEVKDELLYSKDPEAYNATRYYRESFSGITGDKITNLIAKIVKEELDPNIEEKKKQYTELLLKALSPKSVDTLADEAAEQYYSSEQHINVDYDDYSRKGSVSWKRPHDSDIIEIIIDSIADSAVLDHFFGNHDIPEDDHGLVTSLAQEIVEKYFHTPRGAAAIESAIDNAEEDQQSSDYIKKHGLDAFYGVEGMFPNKR